MSLSRREFLRILAVAAGAGASRAGAAHAQPDLQTLYDLPKFGNVSLLHFTDCHAQLLPIYYREPHVNLGLGEASGRPPHLVGEHLLRHFGIVPDSPWAHAFTHLDFAEAARRYGKVGGFAHLATLVKRLRAERPGALLLDGGDTWQGSATALWSNGEDMADAAALLGVDAMTAHWEFTLGAARVKALIERKLAGKTAFLAQNVATSDFGDAVFDAEMLREINGVPVAIIGQAYPYTPIAHPAHKIPGWTFGIQEDRLQARVERARASGAALVVLLSHNGIDIDLKLAQRVSGIDLILGGHTHDALPRPSLVANRGGTTLVTSAGSHGKYLAVIDLKVSGGRLQDYRYHLLPIFAGLLPADRDMQKLIEAHRAPYRRRLEKKLAHTDVLLYRRGNFTGSFDQLILDAMLAVMDSEIALSPGFRWGPALLPGEAITWEALLAQTAITYPQTEVRTMTGAELKAFLEDKADNVFNPDPYRQQGGDMTRVGGLQFALDPRETMGSRISDMRLAGRPIDPNRRYKVASWAPLSEGAAGAPIWNVVARYLKNKRVVTARPVNVPKLIGMGDNPGLG